MVNTKRRLYIFGFVTLALILIGSAMLIWDLFGNYGKEQDKAYSGAKLVNSVSQNFDVTQ